MKQFCGGTRLKKACVSWFALFVSLCVTLSSPAWIPLVMGGVPSKPNLLESPKRDYALASPWDRINYYRSSGDESSMHEGFPTNVDPAAFRTTGGEPNVRSLVRPAFAALGKVTSQSDVALSEGDRTAARRVLLALDFWARSDAFRGSPREYLDILEYATDPPLCDVTGEPWNIPPPVPVRTWSDTYVQLGPNGYGEPFFLGKVATGVAVAFLQIRNAIPHDSVEAERIKAWFRGDLMQFQKDFAILCLQSRQLTDHVGRPLPDPDMMLWGWEGAHNKVFCSLAAVTALAIAADDEASFTWAVDAFDFVLNQIEDDGTHRATLYEKGGRALLYHNFIADTIVPLALLADANGHQFLSDPRLTRLIRRVVTSMDDPAYFEDATGYPQEHGRYSLGGTSGWTVMYDADISDPDVASVASPNNLVYPLYAGSGRRFGGHPKFWHPDKVAPSADWIGLARLYVWVVSLALMGSLLCVVNWLRGSRSIAMLMVLPILWPLALLSFMLQLRAGSWRESRATSKGEQTRLVVTLTLLLTTLVSTAIGFFWTYLFLRIV